MNTPADSTRRRRHRRVHPWLAGVAAAVLLTIGGCGGGGGDAAPQDPPPAVAPGDPAVGQVDDEGGAVAFTASGVAGRLVFPSDAVDAPTTLTVTPVAPADGEWLRLRVSGLRGVLPRAVTLTLTLPDGSTAAANATGVVRDGAQLLPLPTTVDAGGRSVVVTLQQFAEAAPAAAQRSAKRRPQAEAPAEATEFALLKTMSRSQVYGAVEETIRVHEREQQFATAFKAAAALTTVQLLLESDGGTPDPLGVGLLADLKRIACANLNSAVAAATLTEVPAFAPGGLEVVQWRARLVEPVHFWLGIVARLGDGPCAGVDADAALLAAETRYRNAAESRLAGRRDAATLAEVMPGLARANTLIGQDRLLAVPALGERVQQEVLQPLVAPLRATAWDASANGTTHDHYGDVLRVYGLASALAGDLQMVGTSLYATSYEGATGSAALGSGGAGGGAGYADTRTTLSVPARPGGTVDVSGPIAALHCPAAAAERLVVEFEGAKVLDRPSVGSRLLDGQLAFDVSALLAAAAIDPATRSVHTLLVKRVGSGCNAVLGVGDAVLVQVRLDFAAGQPPEPSKITGKRFTGSVVEYYMPYDNAECSRSCLDQNPGSNRCKVNATLAGEISVLGDPRAYSTTYRWHEVDPAVGPWSEGVFTGSGTASSFSGSALLAGASSARTLAFSVDDGGRLVGQAMWRCHLQEISFGVTE